jgi:Na+/melibiose symporter-like transporter
MIGNKIQAVNIYPNSLIDQSHLRKIGLHQSEVAIALISGPLCGSIFQPYFGRWSDQTQASWGRRKPLILSGTIVLTIALLSLAWVKTVTHALIPSAIPSERLRLCIVIITLFLMFTIWTAIQAVQVGMRALITDGCSQDEQAYANAWASRYSNFSTAMANLLAYLDFLPHAASHDHASSIFQNMSLLAILLLAMTTTISCISVTEIVPKSVILSPDPHAGKSLRDMWNFFLGNPSQTRTICIVQAFSWLGWFPFLYYIVTYVQHSISLLRTTR